MKRPVGVAFLSVLHFTVSGFYTLTTVGSFVGGLHSRSGVMSEGVGFFVGAMALSLLVISVFLAAGYGLWRLKNWGRIIVIAIAGLSLLVLAAGLIGSMEGTPPDDDGNSFERIVYVLQLILFGPYWLAVLPIQQLLALLPWWRAYDDRILLYAFWAVVLSANVWIIWYMMRNTVRRAFGVEQASCAG